MAKKVVVTKKIALANLPAHHLPQPTASQMRYLAEKSLQELEARAARRASGPALPEDAIEEIIEWL